MRPISVLQSLALVALAVGLVVTPVLAQETAVLEEIIVTAAKRETSLQDTPIAITAMTGEMLDSFNIQNGHDMISSVIGLEGTLTAGNLAIAIRGVNSENTNVTSDPTVAFHVDGVFRGRQSGGLAVFHDVERVETLKGPQGTLYGRNATAGSINVITRKPVHDTEGSVEVLTGNYNRLGLRGVFNTSVVEDRLAVRLSFMDEDREGYFDNGPTISPYGDSVESAYRLHALITPSDRLSVLLTADYQERGGTGQGTNVLRGLNDVLETDLPNPHTLLQNTEGSRDDSFQTLKAEINYSFDSADLTYIGAHYESDVNFGLDFDRSLTFMDPLNIQNGSEQMSHEFRLASNGDGRLQWLTGLYSLDEDASRFVQLGIARFAGLVSETNVPIYNVKSTAVFGQGTYSVSDSFRITAGLRYTGDEKYQTDTSYIRTNRFGQSVVTVSNDGSWSSTDWTLGVDWNPVEDTMIYAKVGTGFKAGAFNVANPRFNVLESTFRPEEILAFQVGQKSSFNNNRMQINSEFFVYDYTDLQVTQRDDDQSVTRNAASADILGFESELVALPTDALRVTLGVGYLDATFGEFTQPSPFTGIEVDLAGVDLVKSPKWSMNANLDYVFDLANGWQVIPRIRTAYRSDMKLLPHEDLGSLMPARSITDASIDVASANERLRIRLFATNITDVVVWSGAGTNGQGHRTLTGSPPMFYGASLRYSFGE